MPLTNSQYNTLMRAYEEKQVRSRDLQNARFEKACRLIPELRQLEDSISRCSVEQAKKLLNGDDSALASLKDQLQELSTRRMSLLKEAGLPSDYLEPSYDCPDCHDTGYVDNHKCHCFQKATIDLFYTQSHLKGLLETENFDSFSFDYYSQNYIDRLSGQNSLQLAKRAYNECQNFIQTFDSEHNNLLLFGTTD